jgi:hypothetical protein
VSALFWPGVLWLIVAAILGALVVSLKRLDKKVPKASGISHLDEWHHGWLILFPIGMSAVLTFPFWLWLGLAVVFTVVATDDAWQHYKQAYHDHAYKSPGWRAYRWLSEKLT